MSRQGIGRHFTIIRLPKVRCTSRGLVSAVLDEARVGQGSVEVELKGYSSSPNTDAMPFDEQARAARFFRNHALEYDPGGS